MSSALKHVHIPCGVAANRARVNQWGLRRLGTVLWDTPLAVAGNSSNLVGFEIDLPDATVFQVRHVQLFTAWVECDAHDIIELGFGCRTTVPTKASLACPCECFDSAAGINPPDAVVPTVGNVHRVIRRDGQIVHAVEGRLVKRAAVAPVTFAAVSANLFANAIGQAMHPASLQLDDPHAAFRIEINSEWPVEWVGLCCHWPGFAGVPAAVDQRHLRLIRLFRCHRLAKCKQCDKA